MPQDAASRAERRWGLMRDDLARLKVTNPTILLCPTPGPCHTQLQHLIRGPLCAVSPSAASLLSRRSPARNPRTSTRKCTGARSGPAAPVAPALLPAYQASLTWPTSASTMAAFGHPRTTDRHGIPSSTYNALAPLARSPSHRPIQTSFMSAPAPGSFDPTPPAATALLSQRRPGEPGPNLASRICKC